MFYMRVIKLKPIHSAESWGRCSREAGGTKDQDVFSLEEAEASDAHRKPFGLPEGMSLTAL